MMLETDFETDTDITRARAPLEAFKDFIEFAPAGAKAGVLARHISRELFGR